MAATLTALQADGHQLVITSGPDAREQAMVERILALCPPQGVISLAGQLTLRQLAALIDHASCLSAWIQCRCTWPPRCKRRAWRCSALPS